MTLEPTKPTYRIGANVTLSCSADSSPAASIWWMVNGTQINETGSHLQLQNVTESNSGNYTCMFHNAVTSRFASESKMIKILGKTWGISFNILFQRYFQYFLDFGGWNVKIQKVCFLNDLFLVWRGTRPA